MASDCQPELTTPAPTVVLNGVDLPGELAMRFARFCHAEDENPADVVADLIALLLDEQDSPAPLEAVP
jgi:hypothetical protein